MTDIPELTTLLDLAEGRLDPETARLVTGRLAAGDLDVETAREWVAWFHGVSAATAFVEAPVELVARIHGLVPVRPPLAQRMAAAVGGAVARLVQDLQGGPLLAGARGVSAADARQLLFEGADGDEVSVSVVTPVDGRTRIDGQLFADDPARPVTLTVGTTTLDGAADEVGEFSFPVVELPAGPVEVCLVVHTAAGSVHLDLTPYVTAPGPQELS